VGTGQAWCASLGQARLGVHLWGQARPGLAPRVPVMNSCPRPQWPNLWQWGCSQALRAASPLHILSNSWTTASHRLCFYYFMARGQQYKPMKVLSIHLFWGEHSFPGTISSAPLSGLVPLTIPGAACWIYSRPSGSCLTVLLKLSASKPAACTALLARCSAWPCRLLSCACGVVGWLCKDWAQTVLVIQQHQVLKCST